MSLIPSIAAGAESNVSIAGLPNTDKLSGSQRNCCYYYVQSFAIAISLIASVAAGAISSVSIAKLTENS